MQVLSKTTRLRTPVFVVDELTVQADDGRQWKRSVVNHVGSAVIAPMNSDGSVLLVRQWRAPLLQPIWELPAGRLEEGETPLRAARRELAEETGLRAKSWKLLTRLYPSPGYVSEMMHVYLATELSPTKATPEEDEDIEQRWFQRPELEAYLDKGRMQDGKTVAGLLMAWRLLDGQGKR